MLEKIRGTSDVEEEYQDILEKAELAALVKNPWTLLLFRKKYRWSQSHMPSCTDKCQHSSQERGSTLLRKAYACQTAEGDLRCRPQLVCAACSTLFQQWTGEHLAS